MSRKNFALKALKNEGFTLVELMVVVAIIGVLSAIAVPQYQKFQARARQTEAKVVLGAGFTAELAFSTENQSFTACLAEAGVAATGTKIFYIVGFKDTSAATTGCGPTGSNKCNDYGAWTATTPLNCGTTAGSFNPVVANSYIKAGGSATAATNLSQSAATVTKSAFIISAAGQISASATSCSGNSDQWEITEGKALSNVCVGI